MFPIYLVVLIPFLGIGSSRIVALFITIVTFIISLIISSESIFIGPFELGIDELSRPFVLLTTFTRPIVLLSSWDLCKKSSAYVACMLVLEGLLIAFFTVKDLLSFYVFFEAVLVPLFLIVGRWGAEGRVRASYILFLYTLFGSLFILLGILYLGSLAGGYSFELLSVLDLDLNTQKFIWLAFFLALAIKTPLIPFTGWLCWAHAIAPVGGSIVLAGLILKLSVYGFLRVIIPILPDASIYFGPLVQTIAVVTLIYASACTLRQTDIKVLVAYSSICHMAVALAGVFSNTIIGIQGAIVLSLAHGFVSPALFFIVGSVIYDRFHSRKIRYYTGLATYMPIGITIFFLFAIANASTPLTANWVGEFIILAGSFQRAPIITILLATSIVSAAAYSFWLFVRIAFGAYSPSLSWTADLSRREFIVLTSLLIPTFAFGIYPKAVLDSLEPAVLALILN